MAKASLNIIFAVVLVVVFAVGCENERPTVVAPSSDLVLLANKAKGDYPLDFKPIYLDLEFLDSLEYEVFEWDLTPGADTLLLGQMQTWPGGGDVGINIPAEAFPVGVTYPIPFSIQIPTYQSYEDNPGMPLFVRLEPSGIYFLVPLTVMCTYMPWYGGTVDDLYEYFCVTPEYEEFGAPEVLEIDRKIKIKFKAQHFSIWGTGGPVDDMKGNKN